MYLKEIEKKLRAKIPKSAQTSYFDPESYMGTQYPMLGLDVPIQRKIFKEGYSFSTLPPREQLKIWDLVWKEAQIFEVLTQAAFFPEKHSGKLDTNVLWPVISSWIKKVDNWGHSDMLSSCFYKMMMVEKKMIFSQLKKWNVSKNPWERRQSVVTLAMYHRKNKEIGFTPCIQLVENLLNDEDYFVQKGVGWSLREIGTKYSSETWKFLKKNVQQISPTAFSASVEKISVEKKEELKLLRKKR